MEAKRQDSYIKDDIEGHFREYQRCKNYQGILDADTYNFDKTGYQIRIVARSLVITPIDCTAVYINNPANRELLTSVECISAGGYHAPPIIIFKGVYHLRRYFNNNIDSDILWARSDSGFTNDKLTLSWLKHFNQFTENRTVGRYRMLIFDGFGSHDTQDFIDFCQEHRIRPFQLIPHLTHLIQPLDISVFQKSKDEFRKLLREEVFYRAKEITKADFFYYSINSQRKPLLLYSVRLRFERLALYLLIPQLFSRK